MSNDVEPATVLNGALDAHLNEVVIIGRTSNGDLYVASSDAYIPDIMWLIEEGHRKVVTWPHRE